MTRLMFFYLLAVQVMMFSPEGTSAENNELTPLAFSSHPMANAQLATSILNTVYERLGYRMDVTPCTAKRSLDISNSGKVDGEVVRIGGMTQHYPNLIQVPEQLIETQAVVFGRPEWVKQVTRWQDLETYRVGILIGIKFAERAVGHLNPYVAYEEADLFRMLTKGRLDLVVLTRLEGEHFKRTLGLPEWVCPSATLESLKAYHYLHRSNHALVAPVSQQIAKMRASGELQRLDKAFRNTYRAYPHSTVCEFE